MTAATSDPTVNPDIMATLDAVSRRVHESNRRRTAIQVQLESARQQFDQASREAIAEFGTANLDELRSKVREWEAKNAQALADCIQALDTCDALMTRVEAALANPELLNDLLMDLDRLNKEALPKQEARSAVEPAPSPAPAAVYAPITFDAEQI